MECKAPVNTPECPNDSEYSLYHEVDFGVSGTPPSLKFLTTLPSLWPQASVNPFAVYSHLFLFFIIIIFCSAVD